MAPRPSGVIRNDRLLFSSVPEASSCCLSFGRPGLQTWEMPQRPQHPPRAPCPFPFLWAFWALPYLLSGSLLQVWSPHSPSPGFPRGPLNPAAVFCPRTLLLPHPTAFLYFIAHLFSGVLAPRLSPADPPPKTASAASPERLSLQVVLAAVPFCHYSSISVLSQPSSLLCFSHEL